MTPKQHFEIKWPLFAFAHIIRTAIVHEITQLTAMEKNHTTWKQWVTRTSKQPKQGKQSHTNPQWILPTFVWLYLNKPETFFGLQVRCRELDISKILEIFWIFWEDFFGRIFLGGFFWEDFLGGFFWEEFFGRNYLVEINKELMYFSRFWGNFV